MNLKQKVLGLNPERRKLALFGLFVVVAAVFLWMPSASELERALPEPIWRLYSGAQPARPVKPSPFEGRTNVTPRAVLPQRAGEPPRAGIPASLPPVNENARPVVPEAPNVAVPDEPMPLGVLGKFEGRTLLKKRGLICAVSVETSGGEAGQVTAFSTLQCMDPLATYATPGGAKTTPRDAVMAVAGRFLPVSSNLTGTWESGALHFRVVKTIGASDDCLMSSATLTPWASHQAAFEWEDGCGKGEILLTQTAK